MPTDNIKPIPYVLVNPYIRHAVTIQTKVHLAATVPNAISSTIHEQLFWEMATNRVQQSELLCKMQAILYSLILYSTILRIHSIWSNGACTQDDPHVLLCFKGNTKTDQPWYDMKDTFN